MPKEMRTMTEGRYTHAFSSMGKILWMTVLVTVLVHLSEAKQQSIQKLLRTCL